MTTSASPNSFFRRSQARCTAPFAARLYPLSNKREIWPLTFAAALTIPLGAMLLRVVDPDTYVTEVIFKFPGRPDLKLVEALHRRVR